LEVSGVAGSWQEWNFNGQQDNFPGGRIDPHHSKLSHSFDVGAGERNVHCNRLVKFLVVG